MPHLRYSSVDGHLACFHVLAVVHSAAMNVGMNVSFLVMCSPDICPGMGLLDHMIVLFFIFFKETSILFSIAAVPIYIPTKSVGGFPFSTPSTAFDVDFFWGEG